MHVHPVPSPFCDLIGMKYHSQRHHPFPDLCEPFHFFSLRMGDQERDRLLDERRELRDMLLYGLDVPVRVERVVRIEADRAFPVQVHEDVVKRAEMHIAKPGCLSRKFQLDEKAVRIIAEFHRRPSPLSEEFPLRLHALAIGA